MNKVITTVVAWVLYLGLQYCATGASRIPISTNAAVNVMGFRNLYTTATREQAKAKLERFRQAATPITLEEFLGRKLSHISIISGDKGIDRACSLIRELLGSVIIRPGQRGGPSCDGIRWSELSLVTVRAFLEYENGRVGLLESDGTHLFFEDSGGTYWWHRWDALFPREVREERSRQ